MLGLVWHSFGVHTNGPADMFCRPNSFTLSVDGYGNRHHTTQRWQKRMVSLCDKSMSATLLALSLVTPTAGQPKLSGSRRGHFRFGWQRFIRQVALRTRWRLAVSGCLGGHDGCRWRLRWVIACDFFFFFFFFWCNSGFSFSLHRSTFQRTAIITWVVPYSGPFLRILTREVTKVTEIESEVGFCIDTKSFLNDQVHKIQSEVVFCIDNNSFLMT